MALRRISAALTVKCATKAAPDASALLQSVVKDHVLLAPSALTMYAAQSIRSAVQVPVRSAVPRGLAVTQWGANVAQQGVC